MGEQTFVKIRKTLVILLMVCFLVTVTAATVSTRCEITWFNFDTVVKRFHALLHDFVWIKKCIPQVISFQLLSAAKVTVYEHINFGGRHLDTNSNQQYVGDQWNDKISSIQINSGTWRFYEHANYGGRYWDLGPGKYFWVENVGIPNDLISSFKRV